MSQGRGATFAVSDGLRRHIDMALTNVDNSFQIFEMESRNIPAAGVTVANTHISRDRFAGNVMILADWIIPTIQDDAYKDSVMGKNSFKDAELFHQAIIQLLERGGFFLAQVQRTMVR